MSDKQGVLKQVEVEDDFGDGTWYGHVDEEGRRQGDWKLIDEAGDLVEEGTYRDDKKVGIWLQYDEWSGQVDRAHDFGLI